MASSSKMSLFVTASFSPPGPLNIRMIWCDVCGPLLYLHKLPCSFHSLRFKSHPHFPLDDQMLSQAWPVWNSTPIPNFLSYSLSHLGKFKCDRSRCSNQKCASSFSNTSFHQNALPSKYVQNPTTQLLANTWPPPWRTALASSLDVLLLLSPLPHLTVHTAARGAY